MKRLKSVSLCYCENNLLGSSSDGSVVAGLHVSFGAEKKNEIVKVKKNAVNFNLGNIYNMRAEDIYITFYKVGF